MANPNYLDILERKALIEDIKSAENIERKRKSLKDYEIYNDNAYKYVYDKLVKQLSAETACQMPIVANINISKAVVNKEATIYSDCPERTYENISEADKEVLEHLYEDCGFDSILGKANKYYKLRSQAFLQVVPKFGKLKLRVLQPHNIDVVPDALDPEIAFAYVVSTFDKRYAETVKGDSVNQRIGDQDDYLAALERYQVTTDEITFVMDGKANILGEILPNPIGMKNFIDISKDKDFEFYVRIGQALADFTIDFNAAWSDLMYTSRMQGFSIGVLSGDPNLKPQTMTVGPAKILFLPKSSANPDSKLEFDFKSPTPNIEASLKAIESLISLFLSTRGIDIKAITVTGGNTYSSALEKLLAMIDQFKATKDDFDLFYCVEKELHKIVTKYLALLSGTNLLDPKYSVTQSIVDSELNVQFKEPQMVETTAEKIANGQAKIDMGISDRTLVLMDIEGLSEDAAKEKIMEIDQRRQERFQQLAEPADPNQDQPQQADVNNGDTVQEDN